MSEESGNLEYNNLLRQARGSAKYWIPKLCDALRREDSKLSREDIRDRIEKDCIDTWQKPTIRDALPEEYKDKARVEQGKRGRHKQLVAPTVGQLVSKTENQPDESRAKYQTLERKEPDSKTFELVITEIPIRQPRPKRREFYIDSKKCEGWPCEKYFKYVVEVDENNNATRIYSI